MFGEPERPRRRLAPRHLIGALVVGSALLAAPAAAPAALPQTSGLVDLLDQANFRV
ncbi:MAG: hypothetical protein QOD53_2052, partial [Thermoleophilaceae bacterium]|nr:hypothetical protein [Thermoleophilaceae bacterium]